MGVVKDGDVDRLACYVANMPDKQSAGLMAIESLGQRTPNLQRPLSTGLSLNAPVSQRL